MNQENLIKAALYFHKEVPKDLFDIRYFRQAHNEVWADFTDPICNTIGCATGHLTAIIPKNEIIYHPTQRINFIETSCKFLGITKQQWSYLFEKSWYFVDETLEGVIKRIFHLLDGNEVYEIRFSLYSHIDIDQSFKKYIKSMHIDKETFEVGKSYRYSQLPQEDTDDYSISEYSLEYLGQHGIHIRIFETETDIWFIYDGQANEGIFKCVYNS